MGVRKMCELEFCDLPKERGDGTLPGVRATCECGAETVSYGQEAKSVKRCMVLMREECRCPDGAGAFFTCEQLQR
jgi:hypothetical protein